MDPPHGLPRKRKQVPDDVQDIEPAVVDDCQQVPNIPRYSFKRQRLHRPDRFTRHMKKGHSPSRPPPVDRLGNDIEDHGIVSKAAPGPLSGSLLHLRKRPSPIITIEVSAALDLPVSVDVAMARVPSTYPYVSRNTLKELDLDVILRSPQLRHDLMFDNGLQFRPTYSRRKRQLSEAYWNALIREVESGCTCFSVDKIGAPMTTPACVCNQIPIPPLHPIIGYCPALQVMTVRSPSRIRPLLSEFLEVLLLVIQPLQSVSGMYVNPDSFKAQMEEHSTQANYIRSIIDPALIEQELRHNLFDLSSLLRAIGVLLKGHCAPMRDSAVEDMVRAAETCKPGGPGTKAEGVNALRTCLEILELMKLDIANHQLQSLRLSISRTSAVYELQNFQAKFVTCHITRQWLKSSAATLLSRSSRICHPLSLPDKIDFQNSGHNQQIYLCALKGVIDLVFHAPGATSGEKFQNPSTLIPDYPETLHLDRMRLRSLSKDLDDIVISYMLLLLFRQLVYSSAWDYMTSRSKPDDATLLKIKNEIMIINSARPGHAMLYGFRQTDAEGTRSADFKENVVLHIARRAQQFRETTLDNSPSASSSTLNSPATTPPTSPISEDESPVSPSSPFPHAPYSLSSYNLASPPETRILNVARRWVVENINIASPLCSVIYDRLHEVVFTGVVAQAYPGRQCTTGQLFSSAIESSAPLRQGGQPYTMPLFSGMEPLVDEIRNLTDKISRVVIMHLNVYLPIYELNGFLEDPILT
ncbi:T-complex protein 11-domain-containing protein [Lentinula edodes]|nr:T-complex protein 11-domain-containing protein [Lentinula edodes]